MAPIISQMEAIIYSPNADAIIGFANAHPWGNYIDSIRYPQIYEETLEFYNNTLQTLNTNPNDSGALRDASVFFQDYLRHYLNLPNVIGASGSLFGILLAFGMMFPNMKLYMIFIPIPIKAKYLMIGYGAMDVIFCHSR